MIHFFTIVLDGMPFIRKHHDVLKSLSIPWTWHVSEGVSHPNHCTSGVAEIQHRLSQDGTTEYLKDLAQSDPRVHHYARPMWEGKIKMVNVSMLFCDDHPPFLIWEIDSDEVWTAHQIETVFRLFKANPEHDRASFWCRYFVGPDIITTTRNTWGNLASEGWKRVWRYKPGFGFSSHEPPVIHQPIRKEFLHDELERQGCVFDHFGFATEAQARFKEVFYKKPGLLAGWKKLQANKSWPIRLSTFWPWIKDTFATRLPHKAGDPSLGQILPDSDFGKLLTRLASKCRSVVEVGTWKGQGSTVCLASGLPTDGNLISIESDFNAWSEASAYWRRHGDYRVRCLHGRVVESQDMKPFNEPPPFESRWWHDDLTRLASCPNVLPLLPAKIDMLMLDGGEWTSEAEMEVLVDRCNIIVLDDTNPSKSVKNAKNRELLIQRGWRIIADEPDHRNGYAAFRSTTWREK